MAKRNYPQFCALARAFDVVGERWTPLLLREMAVGPRRYADLQEALPGVATSLLAQRLKELEADGIVRKRFLSPPAARWVYDLTDEGRELAEALIPLARWGVRRLGTRGEDEAFSMSWILLFLRETADKELAKGVHDVYEFHIDDDVFHVLVDDGTVDAAFGPAPAPPTLTVTTDFQTFVDLGSGAARADDPAVASRLHVDGDGEAALRCLRILAPAAVPVDRLPAHAS